ncbi:hypothetical protein DF185_03025 [Marinifilum breve]|uniref:Uncharacterized protein n=1 Tax=Marinifilum breve TaxID=2184082 RepID=A0A2V4A3I4_9BACT|nr:hypothetical protein DF185_03025 [Marinifilum breve]
MSGISKMLDMLQKGKSIQLVAISNYLQRPNSPFQGSVKPSIRQETSFTCLVSPRCFTFGSKEPHNDAAFFI